MVVASVLYDPASLGEAARRLRFPDDASLQRAARSGLGDPDLRRQAQDLFQLALEGARRLPDLVSPEEIRTAEAFYDRYTGRGMDPGVEWEARCGYLRLEAG